MIVVFTKNFKKNGIISCGIMRFYHFINIFQGFYHIRIMARLIQKYTNVRNYFVSYLFRIQKGYGVFYNPCLFKFFLFFGEPPSWRFLHFLKYELMMIWHYPSAYKLFPCQLNLTDNSCCLNFSFFLLYLCFYICLQIPNFIKTGK